ncbi:DEAD/DEAH box helicase [Bifidobacterium dolichotidis]|uniref:DEAD/DEAH box helicase n=1 Tax=Bifidobacterium dolichotidis TaxID=2306976 RepID=A0A430FT52_9BIFI|nr:DEAD/DEAH box helicase [Bifidobacterium dolichotidis]RSX56031.1 DEAD/DEAH box helicase [Bifidobacterium dolichotidis]
MTRHRRHKVSQTSEEPIEESPAERYQRFQKVKQQRRSVAYEFAQTMPFELDEFQTQANEALEQGKNVLVAAPTGAGKTVVADFAVYLAQQRNVKTFYTTPIKALSNQKYHDLVAIYGADKVGLLTGDTSINSEADIVVMTTEVLRNMLYEHSSTLEALQFVVLDEVHFLADKFRGPVWEEVIIHLPKSVKIVGLSATVSNVEDFAKWIESVRGETKLVVSEHRPVPLEQHVIIQKDPKTEPELFDLYRFNDKGQQTTKINGRLVARIDEFDRRAERRAASGRPYHRKKGYRLDKHGHRPRADRYVPKRWAVVDELNFLDLLPAIYFIFSRNGCDEAVEHCLSAGLQLTTDDEARRIREIVDDMIVGQLTHDDLKTLHFARFRYALEQGFAPHHAGMVALFRQIVERLFEEGLVKVVFATETLALGINMPARSVVLEKLEKYDGTGIVGLTPGEYTQLTGRAGRRGIDTIGHAVVVDYRGFKPEVAAALSSKRVYPLHSSFKPTFNMAVNLLNSSDYEMARTTLDHSFAQWEANESSWRLEADMQRIENSLRGYEKAFKCEHGDIADLMRIRMQLSDLQKHERKNLKHREFEDNAARSRAYRQLDARIAKLKQQEAEHPAHECPDFDQHMRWGHRWAREMRELERIKDRYESRTGSVARQFDRICSVLTKLNYLEQTETKGQRDYVLTERGQLLRRIYSERDLLLAEAIEQHVFDELKPAELAGVLSSIVYEARRGAGGEPRYYPGGPYGRVSEAVTDLKLLDTRLNMMCEDENVKSDLPMLDFGISDVIYEWASGKSLAEVLHNSELTGGDFVRTAKRLADVLQQIAVAQSYMPEDEQHIADVAHEAYDFVNRGIVAYSGVD